MIVKRIVANVAATEVARARSFYVDILGLDVVMDQGWIVTFAAPTSMLPQISVAAEGGAETAVPDISIEVDDLDEAFQRCRNAKLTIEYGPAIEDWGVRRFYVRDPFSRLINILAHN